MANIKGFSGEKRLETQTYATVSQLGSDKSGLDVLPKAMFSVNGATALTVTAQVYGRIKLTTGIKKDVQLVTFGVAHTARLGDVLRFTTGVSASIEATIVEIVDANSVYVGTKLPVGALDDCLLMRHVTLTVDSSGSLSVSSGPNQFIKDSVTETVTEDTVTPANNLAQPSAMFIYRNGVQLPINHDTATPANTVPVPVQITDVTGDITITAGDINVQTTHLGASADSVRIGDGTNELAMNASLEATVHDADALVELQAILAKIIAAPSTEAKQDTAITALGSLLTELQLKADLTETQPVSMATSPLPTGAATEVTLAALAAEDFATQTTLALLEGKDFATQTTLALLEAKDFATQTTLVAQSAKLPSVIGQNLAVDSMSVVLASDAVVETKGLDALAFGLYDAAVSGTITDAAYTEIIADTGATAGKKLRLVCEFGVSLLISVGAAASEVDKAVCQKGGFADGALEIILPANSRISVKAAVSGESVTAGTLYMNVVG